jgi:hypothetical protein
LVLEIIEPARLKAGEPAEGLVRVHNHAAGPIEMSGEFREHDRDKDHQRAEGEDEIGARRARALDQRLRHGEDARPDNAVEGDEGGAHEPDVAFQTGPRHPSPHAFSGPTGAHWR